MDKIRATDMIIRIVPDYGFLPILKDVDSDRELYRGEFYQSSEEALHRLIDRIEELVEEIDKAQGENE